MFYRHHVSTDQDFLNDEPHPEKSGLFLYLNTNKKSITLNLESEEGQGLFLRLVPRATSSSSRLRQATLTSWA
jgi:crotonobetainyl-CoA:carnitine CoA-transferase CaiB-like acyl-CoA transferase